MTCDINELIKGDLDNNDVSAPISPKPELNPHIFYKVENKFVGTRFFDKKNYLSIGFNKILVIYVI